MRIIANDGEIIVEGKDNIISNVKWTSEEHLSDFIMRLYHPIPTAGTYIPDPGTMEAARESLFSIFYDRFTGKYQVTVEDNDLPDFPEPGGPNVFY